MSVLVTAFWRRGKPVSPLTPSVRLQRSGLQGASLLVRSQNSSYRIRGRCGATDTRERPTAARAAEERKKREPLTSRNRVVSRRRNSGKGVVHTIRGFRGRRRQGPRDPRTARTAVALRRAWKAGCAGHPPSQHRPGTARIRPAATYGETRKLAAILAADIVGFSRSNRRRRGPHAAIWNVRFVDSSRLVSETRSLCSKSCYRSI